MDDATADDEPDNCQRDNSSYSPDYFNMIRDVIHLYPLWSVSWV